jgi:phosphatidylinositol glycan class M
MAHSIFFSYCLSALLARLILIAYADFHDSYFEVPYTDVDYNVFTDAARYTLEKNSPFERHAYRYSPFLPWLLVPNVVVHKDFGKLLFSVVDILIAFVIREIMARRKCNEFVKDVCAVSWLFNPLTMVISTRGNADSLAVFLVIFTLDLLLRRKIISAGILHGISVHFRLYPIIFSLSMFLSLSNHNRFIPNKNQWKLVLSCIFSLSTLTAISYYLYGYKFLYESILYHLVRRDTKHNFSVYFYMLYLSADQPQDLIQKVLIFLPQLLLFLMAAYHYSERSTLPFAMFIQAAIAVIYNPVITSQYFFWFLSLLPLSLPNIKMSLMRSLCLTCAWILGQAVWLFAAYILEFRGLNSFYYLWLSSLIFFSINVKILIEIIRHYKY